MLVAFGYVGLFFLLWGASAGRLESIGTQAGIVASTFVLVVGVFFLTRRAGAEATMAISIAIGMGLLVAYFSGESGSPGPMISFLTEYLGIDPDTAMKILIVVRKLLHFCFYGLLAGIALRGLGLCGAAPAWAAISAFGWAACHAVFDEWRQLSAPGRTGAWTDVLLDLSGAIVFITWMLRRNAADRAMRTKQAGGVP